MPGTAELIIVQDLSKNFRRKPGFGPIRSRFSKDRGDDGLIRVLRSITFSAEEGEVLGILGRNGAGKTTLLKIIATIVAPDAGSIMVNGFDQGRPQGIRSSIGLVTGNERSFYWRLTGRANLSFFASLFDIQPALAGKRIDELTELLGLTGDIDRPFDRFSAGMKQRLEIARALLHDPPVLLLDEPTKSLDPGMAGTIGETVRRLAEHEKRTILLVTHRLSEAVNLCDRVMLLDGGRIAADTPALSFRQAVETTREFEISIRSDRFPVKKGVLPIDDKPKFPPGWDFTFDQNTGRGIIRFGSGAGAWTAFPDFAEKIESYDFRISQVREREKSIEQLLPELVKNRFDQTKILSQSAPSAEIGFSRPKKSAAAAAEVQNIEPVAGKPRHIPGPRRIAQKLFSFLKRDAAIRASYRLDFLFQIASIFFSVAVLFFIGKLVGEGEIPALSAYGGNFTAFLLVGVAMSGYLAVSLGAFADVMRTAQVQGTLEMMLVSPTSLALILVASSLWSFLFTTVTVLVYFFAGKALGFFSIDFASLAAAVIILFLTVIVFSAVGIGSAAFILVFKRGNPLNYFLVSAGGLLGGVFFPVSILPDWLQAVSLLLPITHALEGMRRALLTGCGPGEVVPQILVLTIFAGVLVPASFYLFRIAVAKARRDGSLARF